MPSVTYCKIKSYKWHPPPAYATIATHFCAIITFRAGKPKPEASATLVGNCGRSRAQHPVPPTFAVCLPPSLRSYREVQDEAGRERGTAWERGGDEEFLGFSGNSVIFCVAETRTPR